MKTPHIFNRKAEIESILEDDDSRLSEVWEGERKGYTPNDHAHSAGLSTTGYVSNNKQILSALIEGTIPKSPWIANQAASKVRNWLKTKQMSSDLESALKDLLVQLNNQAENKKAQDDELEKAIIATNRIAEEDIPCVYVYSFPPYIKDFVDPDQGRTHLKVGKANDFKKRVKEQVRTAFPEDPIILRRYPTTDALRIETQMHKLLKLAGHQNSSKSKEIAGQEWFTTSTYFLDALAEFIGLKVLRESDIDV